MAENFNVKLTLEKLDLSTPTLLFEQGAHSIYWLGILEDTAFRCNVYLIKDEDKAWIVDPGSSAAFPMVKDRAEQVLPLEAVEGLIICHQDPDVAASMTLWLKRNRKLKVYTTPRTQVLLPYYGTDEYDYVNVVAEPTLRFSSGSALSFIEAPFLHSPGAFTTLDTCANALFSGDIWAALDENWQPWVTDFKSHIGKLDLFHKDYMASNIATNGFVNKIQDLALQAILPQHGSMIPEQYVENALTYLKTLRCGTDIIYADLGG